MLVKGTLVYEQLHFTLTRANQFWQQEFVT